MDFSDAQGLQSVGWRGFLDTAYMLQSLAALALSTILAVLIAYHPTTRRNVDTVEEAELPKAHIMCALVGAVVGVIVLEYGLVVGFVVFGIGGLMRFRTNTATTRDAPRLIIVTLIGLISGLNLPHFAVLAGLYAWVVIFLFDGGALYNLEVKGIDKGRVQESADAYYAALAGLKCSIISETRSAEKQRAKYLFRAPRSATKDRLKAALSAGVPADLRGELAWEVE